MLDGMKRECAIRIWYEAWGRKIDIYRRCATTLRGTRRRLTFGIEMSVESGLPLSHVYGINLADFKPLNFDRRPMR